MGVDGGEWEWVHSLIVPICFYKLFLINENKNTEYLNNDYANVMTLWKITSISTHNRQKYEIRNITDRKHKKAQQPKKLVFQKNW